MAENWLKKILNYFSEIWFLWTICLLLIIITFLLIHYKIQPGRQTMALHYNVIVGVDWYGKGTNIYLIPVIGLVIAVVNFIAYKTFRKHGHFLSFLSVLVSIFVQIILLLSVLFLMRVN